MSNGQVLEASTGKAPAAQAAPAATVTKADRAVAFASAKPAVVNIDLVGKNKKRAASGSKDTSVNIKVTGSGNVTAIVLTDNTGKGWDTLPANNGRWLLGVRGQQSPQPKERNGSHSGKRHKTLQLLMQDNGYLAKKMENSISLLHGAAARFRVNAYLVQHYKATTNKRSDPLDGSFYYVK